MPKFIAICYVLLALCGFERSSAEHSLRHLDQYPIPGDDRTSLEKKVVEVPLRGRWVGTDGRYYYVDTSIGTKPQAMNLVLDTGSTDTWLYGTRYCGGGLGKNLWHCCENQKSTCIFYELTMLIVDNVSASSTARVLSSPPFFNATYGEQKIGGIYVEDTFKVTSTSVDSLRFGLIDTGNITAGGGLLGLGFDTAEFAPNTTYKYLYPDLLDTLFNESVIASRSFGLSICNNGDQDSTGSLTLGGIDTTKMIEPLVGFDIVSPQTMDRLGVPLVSISLDVEGEHSPIWNASSDNSIGNAYIPAVLDSGATNTQIPLPGHRVLIEKLNNTTKGGMFEKRRSREPWLGDMDCKHRALNATRKIASSPYSQQLISHASDLPLCC
jgi:hypothetical protein